jgi:hypothetical protein
MHCWLGFYFIELLISMQCWRQDRFCASWPLTLRIRSSSRDIFQISNRPSCMHLDQWLYAFNLSSCGTIQISNLWILNLCMHLDQWLCNIFSNPLYASWPVTIYIQSAIMWHDSNFKFINFKHLYPSWPVTICNIFSNLLYAFWPVTMHSIGHHVTWFKF